VFDCNWLIFSNSIQHNRDVWPKRFRHSFSIPIITGNSFVFTLHISYISTVQSGCYFNIFQLLSISHLYALTWQCLLTKMFLCHHHELWCPGCEGCDSQQFKDSHILRQKVQSECSASFQQLHNAHSEYSQLRCNYNNIFMYSQR